MPIRWFTLRRTKTQVSIEWGSARTADLAAENIRVVAQEDLELGLDLSCNLWQSPAATLLAARDLQADLDSLQRVEVRDDCIFERLQQFVHDLDVRPQRHRLTIRFGPRAATFRATIEMDVQAQCVAIIVNEPLIV